jgi:F-type H+/Na+-transporting ATPase subunit beta
MAVDTGRVVQVLGNVVDVEFTPETLPKINEALHVGVNTSAAKQAASNDGQATLGGTAMAARQLTLEVQDGLGDNQVRCLALGSTDGLVRGAAVQDRKSVV